MYHIHQGGNLRDKSTIKRLNMYKVKSTSSAYLLLHSPLLSFHHHLYLHYLSLSYMNLPPVPGSLERRPHPQQKRQNRRRLLDGWEAQWWAASLKGSSGTSVTRCTQPTVVWQYENCGSESARKVPRRTWRKDQRSVSSCVASHHNQFRIVNIDTDTICDK